ncbi:MAG: non-heme iron oxygenase ferredoxin subunit [Magnetococcales bacterium]|nr:non-heme iron oxygenase ferredoxin subunit [Magnetococcales bacterium]
MNADREWRDVAGVERIPIGALIGVEVAGEAVVLCNPDGRLHAIEDCCSHDGGDLSSGRLAGGEIVCPRHGARFDVRTGRALGPPAYEDIRVVPVRVLGDRVQIGIAARG